MIIINRCVPNMVRISWSISVGIAALWRYSFALEQRTSAMLAMTTSKEWQVYRRKNFPIVLQVLCIFHLYTATTHNVLKEHREICFFLNKLGFWNRFQKFTTLYYFAMQVCKNQSRLYLWSSTIIGAQCLSRFEPYQQCNWFYKVKEEKLGFFSHSSMLGNDLMQLYIWQ